jgi:hypothetical protein
MAGWLAGWMIGWVWSVGVPSPELFDGPVDGGMNGQLVGCFTWVGG